jgi:CheY-like chemotaxis protein
MNVRGDNQAQTTIKARSPNEVSILVVDDEPDVREGVCDALTDEGYNVIGAANGAEAFRDVVESARPDLILMDLCMPVMSGYQFLEQRAKNHALSKIPIIVVSATALPKISQPGVEVLKKPLDLEALLALIPRLLRWQPRS